MQLEELEEMVRALQMVETVVMEEFELMVFLKEFQPLKAPLMEVLPRMLDLQ